MLKDPKHPMTPGNITDDVSRVYLEGVSQIKGYIFVIFLNKRSKG